LTAINYGRPPKGFRLPDDTHVGQVHLQVTDLDRSLAFYEGLLGFVVRERHSDRAVLAAADAAAPPLIELQTGARGPLSGRRLGLYHFAVLLPDRVALGRFLQRLFHAGIEPGAADHLVSEALYLQDPDGLGIEVYRDRPREEWRVRGDEIAMTTDRLDFKNLLEAGGSEEWNGMPAGTTIGHVHLHVGDIETAKDFYHKALGFDLVVWSYPGALFMSAGGYHHHLGVNTWAGPKARPAEAAEPKLIDWELVLPTSQDVAAAAQSLLDHGYAPTPEEVGGSITLDPWETAVRLTARS